MNNIKRNLLSLFVILLVSIITMLPMFLEPYKSGHDTKFHISNITSLTENIEDNFLKPSPILPHIANDFGYGTGLFYPPLAHTATSYINTIVQSETISLKIVHFIGLFASGVTMFFLAQKVSKSREIGLISSVIYMLFPYHLSNIYIRDALGEELLFVFLPLVIHGLYELFKGNKRLFYPLFIIGYIGGMLCHLTLMVYFTIPIIFFLIFKWKETLKNIVPLIISSVVILAITSPFWVTLLEQKILGNYRVFEDGVMIQGTQGNGLLFGYINIFKNFGNNEVKYFIDLVVLILLGITLIKYRKVNNRFYNYMAIFGIIFIVLSSKLFPWDMLPKATRMFQFPWRFETFVSVSVALIAPLCVNLMDDKKITTLVLIIVMVLFSQANLQSASEEVINLNHMEYVYGMGYQQEYLPVNLGHNRAYLDERSHEVIIQEGSGVASISEDKVPYLSFNIDTKEEVTIELPRIYYIGYTLKKANGDKIKLQESDKGFIEAKVSSGSYTLDFTGTALDKTANYVSFITSGIAILGYVVWRKKNGQN